MVGVLILKPDTSRVSCGGLFSISRLLICETQEQAEQTVKDLPRCYASGDNKISCIIIPNIEIFEILRKEVDICDGNSEKSCKDES